MLNDLITEYYAKILALDKDIKLINSDTNIQYIENIHRLLSDINLQLKEEKYQPSSNGTKILKSVHIEFLEEKLQLEYMKKLLTENNIRRLSCHISDNNYYNNFRNQHVSGLIISDKDLEKITKSKQIYINQHQLYEYFGLNLRTQSSFRTQAKNSPNYLPHHKISSKVILYKFTDIEQWIEERGFGTSDYVLN